MKNLFKIAVLSFGLIFILGPVVFAQDSASPSSEIMQAVNLDENIQAADLGISEPTLLPDNLFYFIKGITRGIRSIFTFNSVAKAELKLKFANEKLMEAKKLIGKPEALSKALEGYKIETDKLKAAANKIKAVDDPKADKFMDKFVDNIIKHEKLLGKFEKDSPPEVYEKIENTKEETIAKFSDIGLKLVSPQVLQEKIIETFELQPGSNFKQFKNLEVLQAIEEKVPEPAKPAIQQAIENSLEKLRGDLEGMSPENREKFKDYVENIGGNETRHLAVMDEFEKEELSAIIKEETEKAKERILERVETRLKEYEEKNLETAEKKYLNHLTGQGRIEDLRTIKEMENSLSPEAKGGVLTAKKEAVEKIVKNISQAETSEQQKVFFEEIENKYHDVKQLEVFGEIDTLIPPEKKELYDKMKEQAMKKMQEEVERAKKLIPEEKTMVMDKLAGDSPEHIKISEEFNAPPEVTQQTMEKISKKIEATEDPAKMEILKGKLEESENRKKIEEVKPEIFGKLEEKSETLVRSITPEMIRPQIQYAKNEIGELERTFAAFLPEIQAELEKTNYWALVEAAKKHLEKAEQAFQKGNFGEALGQSTASSQNLSNAQKTRSKVIMQNGMLEERSKKWTEFVKEVKEKIPEAIPGPIDSGSVLSVHLMLGCSISSIPPAEDCEGKWQIKQDSRNCPFFICGGATKELPCANEGEKVNRDPSIDLTNQQCCGGLVEVRVSKSYSFCKKPGSEGVLECKADFDCPQPLCPRISSKCVEGKCLVPMCTQVAPAPPPESLVQTLVPVQIKPEEKVCTQVITPAISPEGKCVDFPTPCDVPMGWKTVGRCEVTGILTTCCVENVCTRVSPEKCKGAGGRIFDTSSCYPNPCKPTATVPQNISPAPTPTPTTTPNCPFEVIPAIGPDGTCKRFLSSCYVPENWKRVEACPELVVAPDIIGCCVEGVEECTQTTKEQCLAKGGQGVPASYCNIADVCFRLAKFTTIAPSSITPSVSPFSTPTPQNLIGCCMNYSCNLASKEECAAKGGREIGPASDCDITYICGQVGCCLQDGICKLEIQKDCSAEGGKPTGSSCSPNPCPIPVSVSTLAPTSIPAPTPTLTTPISTPFPIIEACAQVITPAIGPDGTCKNFSTACEVPLDWKKVDKCVTETPVVSPTLTPTPVKEGAILKNIKNQVAAILNSVSKIVEQVGGLLKFY